MLKISISYGPSCLKNLPCAVLPILQKNGRKTGEKSTRQEKKRALEVLFQFLL